VKFQQACGMWGREDVQTINCMHVTCDAGC
jgi:hypothetical protein